MNQDDKYYSDFETMNPDERREKKWVAALEVMQEAYSGSGEFKARMEKAGLAPDAIKTPDDWSKIPVFHKKDLIDFQQASGLNGMLSCDVGDLRRIYMSPGPIFDPEGRGTDYWGWTEGFKAAGFRAKDVVQMTFSYHLTPAGLMLEEPLRELGCAVIPAGPGNTSVQLDLMTKLPVTGFVGMASYLKVIKDKAKAKGLDPKKDFKLRTAFVAAERLAPSLRAELEEEIDMVVRQGYGTADVGCAAYECRELSGMHLSSRCWIEICDPKTGVPLPEGETGEVVITPFAKDYPLIRLGTGDLSYLTTESCPCGRTSHRLGAIVGRVDDTVKVKGQFIYPHQVAEVMAGFPNILRKQVVAANPGGREMLTVKLVVEGDLDQSAFSTAFQGKLKLKPALEILASEEDLDDDGPLIIDLRTFD